VIGCSQYTFSEIVHLLVSSHSAFDNMTDHCSTYRSVPTPFKLLTSRFSGDFQEFLPNIFAEPVYTTSYSECNELKSCPRDDRGFRVIFQSVLEKAMTVVLL
jgi:hypothetical protein